LTLKRAVAALDGMNGVAVSVARDGMESVAVYRAVSGWFVLMVLMAMTRHERSSSQLGSGLAESRSLAMQAGCHLLLR
jgi:hypothetical protein